MFNTTLPEIFSVGSWKGDSAFKDITGKKIPAVLSCTLLKNKNGEPEFMAVNARDITERKRAAEVLQESEERFRIAAETSNDVVYEWDLKQNVKWFGKIDEMLGYNPGEFPRTLDGLGASVHPDDWIRVMTAVQAHLEERAPYAEEYRAIKKDGTFRWWSARGAVARTPDGQPIRWVGTVTDITERKQAEEELLKLNAQLEQRVLERTQELQVVNKALNASNEELNTTNEGLQEAQVQLQNQREEQQIILDSIPAWVFYKDKENNFLKVNKVFSEVMGMTKEQLENKSLFNLYPREQAETFLKDDLDVISSGRPKRNIIESMSSPKGTIWVQTDKIPFYDPHGVIIGIIGFTVDITEQKKLEDSLRDQSEKTEASNKELEAFTYSVSHDLRAPLRHISGYVQLLTSRFHPALSEKGQHYLDSIADSVHQMGLLIDNLLQFSRTGRAEMRRADSDMNEIVKEVIESLGKDNPDRSIKWKVAKLPSVFCDSAMMRLVWMNLLSNAVKFTRTREKALIEIGAKVEKKEVIFFVRDNGVGFDMQYAQKLFGVFQRLHPTEEFEGTGIGLANVQRIIMRHGGRTWAVAELDNLTAGKAGGATFYFSIQHN
ncbi:MAG: PAS domain S-box protein [Ignavibacteriales bacterium]|nr:PAS domain S-box protein [Ignavibacteriales bacterium]